MKIIAQKSDATNSNDFFIQALTSPYIDGVALNVSLTTDNQLVIYNNPSIKQAVDNTIQNSTYQQLENYEIILLDDTLKQLDDAKTKKEIYINMSPLKTGKLNDQVIEKVTSRMQLYVEKMKQIVDKYPRLSIHIHSINRNLVTILKTRMNNRPLGFVIYGDDLNYIDVDYYIITMNVFNDHIIQMLLQAKKKVIIYIHSDYYISFLYNHYLGEKSTPELQQTFKQLGLLSNYPEIIDRVFNSEN